MPSLTSSGALLNSPWISSSVSIAVDIDIDVDIEVQVGGTGKADCSVCIRCAATGECICSILRDCSFGVGGGNAVAVAGVCIR